MKTLLDELYFDEDLVKVDLHAVDRNDALIQLATLLEQKGVVQDTFAAAMIDREDTYPTGLMCEVLGVAIPHTDAEHVHKQAVAIAILKEPVQFIQMGTEEDRVDVKIIFMLAIKEPHKQIDLLQALMFAFMESENLKALSNCKTPQEASTCFKSFFEEL